MTTILLSAYCHCSPVCCPKPNNPTASGAMPRVGITISAPRAVPLGTRVNIEGIGWWTVQDRTAKRFDKPKAKRPRWDLFVKTHEEAKRHGVKEVRILEMRLPK